MKADHDKVLRQLKIARGYDCVAEESERFSSFRASRSLRERSQRRRRNQSKNH